MCKNVDDYIKRDFGDKGLCRDLRNPVGNDSIDHHACEYMAPASAVYAAPVPVVEYIAPAAAVSFVAPAPAIYAAPAPVVSASRQHLS